MLGARRRVPLKVTRGVLVAVGAALLGAPAAAAQTVIADDFSRDSLATDYVVHAGDGTLKVENGVLQATAVTPDKVLTHNGTAGFSDTTVTLQANFKGNASSGTTAAVVKFLGPGTYLRLATTYSSGSLKFSKFDNGTRTDLLVVSGLFTLTPNTTYWVRGRARGDVLTVELWGRDPEAGGSPIVARSYTLTGTNATRFGAGVAGRAGIYLDPGETAREFDNVKIVSEPPPAGGTRELVLTPAADTMVKQAERTATFGAATILESDRQELSSSGSAVHSYLRFDVPPLAAGESISGAALSLQVTNATSDGPLVYRTATTWTEPGLTWDNRGTGAPRASSAIGDFARMPLGRIATHLSSVPTGQSVSFELAPQSTDGVDFGSRESGSSAEMPQLVLKIASAGA